MNPRLTFALGAIAGAATCALPAYLLEARDLAEVGVFLAIGWGLFALWSVLRYPFVDVSQRNVTPDPEPEEAPPEPEQPLGNGHTFYFSRASAPWRTSDLP